MCLDYELSKKKSDEIIQQARKRGYIKVYKVCNYKKTGWFRSSHWKKGIRKAQSLKIYNGGWYAFLTRKAAEKDRKIGLENCYIKMCYANPQWIKRIGRYAYTGKAGIFTHLAFPDWDKGTMTVREFRSLCKNYRNKKV